MLYTKITKDNVDTLFQLLNDRKIVNDEQISERFFHVGKFIYVKNKIAIITINEPEGEQVFLRQTKLNAKSIYIECKTHNLLSSDYRYHLYQCKDGVNIWTKQRIELGEHVKIGKVIYKLYPSQERINNPQQSINSDELYYEFTIKEVKL